MPDMSGWLAVKYGQMARGHDIAQQQVDNQGRLQNAQAQAISDRQSPENQQRLAQAGLYNTQAQTLPIEVGARAGLMGAQAGLADTQARLMPSETAAKNDLMRSQGDNYRAQSRATNYDYTGNSTLTDIYNRLYGPGMMSPSQSSLPFGGFLPGARGFAGGTENVQPTPKPASPTPAQTRQTMQGIATPGTMAQQGWDRQKSVLKQISDFADWVGFAAGTERVPGKGSPTVDKVPAVLAPGEAVLNAPAADMAGRGLIAALNQIGRQQMGMV